MYRAAEELLQIALQRCLHEQAPPLPHVYEHIQVTVSVAPPPGDRPKDAHGPRAVTLR